VQYFIPDEPDVHGPDRFEHRHDNPRLSLGRYRTGLGTSRGA
jgi:hypothetical protein